MPTNPCTKTETMNVPGFVLGCGRAVNNVMIGEELNAFVTPAPGGSFPMLPNSR
jgi:hypothetical protein